MSWPSIQEVLRPLLADKSDVFRCPADRQGVFDRERASYEWNAGLNGRLLTRGAYGQLLNFFHASLKLERKERLEGRVRRIYAGAQTPLARVLASAESRRKPSGA